MQAEGHQVFQGLMQTKDWWYLIATILSPFAASFLTLFWQRKKAQRDAKLRVFTSLMAVRGNINNFQAAQEWVRALNLIDVVFADAPDVLSHWHDLYAMLQQQEAQPGQGHKMISFIPLWPSISDSKSSNRPISTKHISREPFQIRLPGLMKFRKSFSEF
jgi:hypothetical protein